MKKHLLFLVLISFLLSCNNQNQQEKNKTITSKTIFIAGKTKNNIVCKKDSSQSYTAYFPENYNQTKETPVIVLFDSHARANLIINKFKNAANNFGYVLIASENIKNGLKTINYSIDILFEDIFSRFKINKNRVYTAGFSGGAKVANSVAIYKGGIAGVIACSGGLPQQGIKIKSKYDFVGIVGINDFNYQEMKTLDIAFNKYGFNSNLIIFNGQHEYPSNNIITNSVELLEISAMKRKFIPVNDNLLRSYTEKEAKTINNFLIKDEDYKAYILYKRFLKNLSDLYDISKYKIGFDTLLQRKIIKQKIKFEEQLSNKEAIEQQKIIGWFKNSDFKTLKQNITSLQIKIRNDNEKHYEIRLLNYIEMLSYIFTNKALKLNDFKNFDQLITIYELSNNKNADKEYFKACKFALDKDNSNALKSLNKAVDFGFIDKDKLINSGYLKELKNNPNFIGILNRLSN